MTYIMVKLNFSDAMFIDNLIQLGFTRKESKVYLMLLRIGPSPVGSLAVRVNLKRVTVYSVLDSLINRGLVTVEYSGKCRRYIPHDPECLLYALERQNAELKFRIDLAKTCIDGLNRASFDVIENGYRITFYRGQNMILETLNKRINQNDDLFVIFLNFGGGLLAADCLKQFLSDERCDLKKCRVALSAKYLSVAKKTFPRLLLNGVDFSQIAVRADLLVQGDQVFFLFSTKDDLQMIVLRDSIYAKFTREVLLSPYFDLKSRAV